jgi:hypothetical protein
MQDPELERFKRLPFVDYAIGRHGYQRDRTESSRHCHVLRHPGSDDKIVVRVDPADGHWTYFSVRDGRDHGTIVDFLQHRGTRTLGEVREELRGWLGAPHPFSTPDAARTPSRPTATAAAPAEAFARARSVRRCAYLENRGLSRETLADPRFSETWRLDRRGNVLFVHRDSVGDVTGFEIKSRDFTGFCAGGRKAVWRSQASTDDRTLVIAESAIDALSYHQIHQLADARYLSTAGTLSGAQRTLLAALFATLAPGALVLAAVDADAGGSNLAHSLEELTRGHPHLAFARHSPVRHKDWNDVLQNRPVTDPLAAPALLPTAR